MVKKNNIYIFLLKIPGNIFIYSKYSYLYIFFKLGFIKYWINPKYISITKLIKTLRIISIKFATYIAYINMFQNILYKVCKYYKYTLNIIGLGFKYRLINNIIYFILGYSHIVKFFLPINIMTNFNKKLLVLQSFDLFLLKEVVLALKRLRPLDAYKAKGLRLKNEIIITKKGKKTTY